MKAKRHERMTSLYSEMAPKEVAGQEKAEIKLRKRDEKSVLQKDYLSTHLPMGTWVVSKS